MTTPKLKIKKRQTLADQLYGQVLEQIVSNKLAQGEKLPSENQIATLFSMTTRTLSRRLESFDTGFHELVAECRFEIAQQMLENTSLNVGEIADSLGYSRASSFIRAFRGWSGTTPTQWRAAPIR